MKKIKIIIAEDEILLAMALKIELESSGFEVCEIVSSGVAAINQTLIKNPDLVLMDIRLEDNISGIEAVKQIHNRKNIPVIYLTAQEDPETIKELKRTDYITLIAKPFQFYELKKIINNYFHLESF